MGENHERKEAEALMKRLEAQFGDVDLDMELLGIGNEDQVALELEEDENWPTDRSREQSATPAATETTQSAVVADAEAAALMARLGAQFGDLDMSQLGLGVGVVGSEGGGGGSNNISIGINDQHDGCERDSDEESSLEDPTPEELEAWQASQFSKGQQSRTQKQASCEGRAVDSVRQRRKLLRNARSKQLTREQTRLRLQKEEGSRTGLDKAEPDTATKASVLDLLGEYTSNFFAPSTASILEDLVSEEVDGDPEILQASWKRLYASYEEGLGFWNLWKALKGYDGPTLLVLRCVPSISKSLAGGGQMLPPTACLGFYTTTPWKDSSDLFGGDIGCEDGDKAFLFSIDEKGHKENNSNRVRFFPVEGKPGAKTSLTALKNGYMYCQPSSKKSGSEVAPATSKTVPVTGLGVGGRPTQPRFHLTESFEDCSCLTYDSSRVTRDGDLFACINGQTKEENTAKCNTSAPLCDEGHAFAKTLYCFDVTELEAWGVGGTDWINHALIERERARKQHILRFQKVDKQMMWDQGAFGSSGKRRSGRNQL